MGAPPRSLPHPGSAQTGRTRARGDATRTTSLFLEGTVCPESLALLPIISLNSRRKWKDWAISCSLKLPDSGQVSSLTPGLCYREKDPEPGGAPRVFLRRVCSQGASFTALTLPPPLPGLSSLASTPAEWVWAGLVQRLGSEK